MLDSVKKWKAEMSFWGRFWHWMDCRRRIVPEHSIYTSEQWYTCQLGCEHCTWPYWTCKECGRTTR